MDTDLIFYAVACFLIAGVLLMLGRSGTMYRLAATGFVSLTALSAYNGTGIGGVAAVAAVFGIVVPLALCTVTRVGSYLAWRQVGKRFKGQPKNAPIQPLTYRNACRLMAGYEHRKPV